MSHGHQHCHHEHEEVGPPDTNESQTLWPYIDHDRVRALNEIEDGSAARVLREWQYRLATSPFLESDVDEELLITIPFTGLVKLHSILLRSFGDDHNPKTLRVFKKGDDLDFGTAADAKPTATFTFPEEVGINTSEMDGIVEFAVNRAHFANITSLTLHIPTNWGAETTRILYIGLRGEWTELRSAPVVTQYEAAANPADHKKLRSMEQNQREA